MIVYKVKTNMVKIIVRVINLKYLQIIFNKLR